MKQFVPLSAVCCFIKTKDFLPLFRNDIQHHNEDRWQSGGFGRRCSTMLIWSVTAININSNCVAYVIHLDRKWVELNNNLTFNHILFGRRHTQMVDPLPSRTSKLMAYLDD
jgi:hypothetical protein